MSFHSQKNHYLKRKKNKSGIPVRFSISEPSPGIVIRGPILNQGVGSLFKNPLRSG